MSEITKLKKQNHSLAKQKSFAFHKYYEECKRSHIEYIELVEKHKSMYEELEELTEPPIHMINELKEMYKKEKKEIDCPICLEVIEIDNLTFSSCCHKYCDKCYKTLTEQPQPKCAICRKKIYMKKQ